MRCTSSPARWAVLLLLAGVTGCGPRLYPVRGKVTLDDGKPLTRGLVLFEASGDGPRVMARGEVQPDGSYQLSTHKPGDGALPGRYRVLLNPMDLSDLPDEKKNLPFDIRYLKYETSGLEFEVRAEPNDIPIQVARPGR
jgi:hypothetical protein